MADQISARITKVDLIWEGDRLKRRSEAKVLEKFLVSECEAMKDQDRDQAIVLALDAQYGEGKSWFLSRFRRQLEINHPVAFVDAWVDDSNSEPLVSIMAALDDALKPFLKTKVVREKLATLTRAALPIIGKAMIGAGGRLLTKHLGDDFGADAKEIIASKSSDALGHEGAVSAGADKFVDGVSEVVDNIGKAMLDQYRTRQRSRELFKENLKQLALSINVSDADQRQAPIFVIVDELDRCRPDYAISLLEEIKHLFDVPGVVFVIALHGNQLIESIKAVYGANFNASSYLRRFFTRRYELRQLSISELVASHFSWIPFKPETFSCPQVWDGERIENPNAVDVAGKLLTEWQVTPREALSVIDGLRLFVSGWNHPVPIELPLVLAMLLHLVKGEEVFPIAPTSYSNELNFVVGHSGAQPSKTPVSDLFKSYNTGMSVDLLQISSNDYSNGSRAYMAMMMRQEFARRFNSSIQHGQTPPMSTWSEYRDRVRSVGRFLESDDAGQQ